jgi:hypothetical protein
MPYKDPERKRQWEREHREERNVRRRRRRLPVVRNWPGEAVLPDLITEQKAHASGNMIAALVVGTFVLALTLAAWRLIRNAPESSVHTPKGVPDKGQ